MGRGLLAYRRTGPPSEATGLAGLGVDDAPDWTRVQPGRHSPYRQKGPSCYSTVPNCVSVRSSDTITVDIIEHLSHRFRISMEPDDLEAKRDLCPWRARPVRAKSSPMLVALAASAVLLGSGGASGSIAAEAPRVVKCQEQSATIVGTSGADRLVGTPGDDVIVGRPGADTIKGRGGRDVICAGKQADRVYAGPDGDRIRGGAGDDMIVGGRGGDQAHGDGGDDRIRLGAGSDWTVGYTADPHGGAGDDVIKGQTGYDNLGGGRGSDTIYGGGAADALGGSYGSDQVYGGLGRDWIQDRENDGSGIGSGVSLPGRDFILGGRGRDLLHATDSPSRLYGSRGQDILCGGPRPDLINGGRARDRALKDQTGDTYIKVERITRKHFPCSQ